jgi:hypothetical protein
MQPENQPYCPCCKSEKTIVKYEVDVTQAAYELASTDDEIIIGRLKEIIHDIWRNNTATWHICQDCGFGFANPFIACNAEYYKITYTDQRFYTSWKWEYEVALKLIKQLVGKESQLLEIGAGQGAFLSRISEKLIPRENILCTEYAEYGSNFIKSLGIECKSEDIFDLVTEKNIKRFGFICMFQVFEHLDKLDDTFEVFNKLASRDCNLFIAVPSDRHRRFYYSIGEFLDYPPGHLGCYTPQGIGILAQRHGWELHRNFYQPTKKRFQLFSLLYGQYTNHTKLVEIFDAFRPTLLKKGFKSILFIFLALMYLNKVMRLLLFNYGVSQFFWLTKRKEYE